MSKKLVLIAPLALALIVSAFLVYFLLLSGNESIETKLIGKWEVGEQVTVEGTIDEYIDACPDPTESCGYIDVILFDEIIIDGYLIEHAPGYDKDGRQFKVGDNIRATGEVELSHIPNGRAIIQIKKQSQIQLLD